MNEPKRLLFFFSSQQTRQRYGLKRNSDTALELCSKMSLLLTPASSTDSAEHLRWTRRASRAQTCTLPAP
jgi:hypothetical protein